LGALGKVSREPVRDDHEITAQIVQPVSTCDLVVKCDES
jgi:hypothetical protein